MGNIRYLTFLTLLLFLASCGTRKVMEEDGRFDSIDDEFKKVVTVDSIPKAEVKKAIEIVDIPPKTDKPKTEVRAVLPKQVKPISVKAKPVKREPELEDDKGFIGRRPIVDPFGIGEVTKMTVSYMGAEAGEISLGVGAFKIVNGKKSYQFTLDVQTSKLFSMFYAVRNRYETLMDYENLTPTTYSSNSNESSKHSEVRIFFDQEKRLATHWEMTVKKKGGEKKKKITWEIKPYTQNYLSVVYYFRAFQYEVGKTYSVHIADSGKNEIFRAEVMSKEKLKTNIGDLNTIKLKLSFTADGQFKPAGENFLWITDDEQKHIVRVESKIKIGTLVAKVKSIEKGHRNN